MREKRAGYILAVRDDRNGDEWKREDIPARENVLKKDERMRSW